MCHLEGDSVGKQQVKATSVKPATCACVHTQLSTVDWDKLGVWKNRVQYGCQDHDLASKKRNFWWNIM